MDRSMLSLKVGGQVKNNMIFSEFTGQSYFAVFWGLCLLATFAGYGWGLTRLLRLPTGDSLLTDMGLFSGLGMCMWIVLGGFLLLLKLVSSWLILGLMIPGLALASYSLLKHPLMLNWKLLESNRLIVVLVILALIVYVRHANDDLYNPDDDLGPYSFFVAQMLQTGTCLDPFCWRRATAFGAQSYLQASCVAFLPPGYINLFDHGLCRLLTFILLLDLIRRKGLSSSSGAILLLVVYLSMPSPGINTTSEESGLFLSLLLVTSCDRFLTSTRNGASELFVIGLVASGLLSLKSQYIIGIAAFFGFVYLYSLIKENKFTLVAREMLWIGLTVVGCLISWSILSYLSSGTPLYPFFRGYQPPNFIPIVSTISPWSGVTWSLNQIFTTPQIMILLVPIVLIVDRNPKQFVRMFGFAAIAIIFVIGFIMSDKSDQIVTIYRYSFGFILAGAFLGMISILERDDSVLVIRCEDHMYSFSRRAIPYVLIILVYVNFPNSLWDIFQVERTGLLNKYPRAWTEELVAYRSIQNAVPPGEPILVYTECPFLFDLTRNPVYYGDIPYTFCPPPPMPKGKGSAALETYLDGLGIHYIIHSDFKAPGQYVSGHFAYYSEPFWDQLAVGPYVIWRIHAPYFLDMMHNIDDLETRRRVIKGTNGLTCLHLK